MTEIATEAGHWYTREGEPAYEVPNKSKPGEMRPTTLGDARKLNLVPSVTTIIKCAAAPALENWKRNQLLMAALTLTQGAEEGTQAFADRIVKDSQEQAKQAAETGTTIHGCIEKWLCLKDHDRTYLPHVEGAVEALREWCGSFLGIRPEKSFCHELGYGGKVDVHKAGFVADFKCKDFTENNLPLTYENHSMQLAAYREGFNMPTARCAIIYVSTSVPGLTHLVEVDEEELARGWNMFRALLAYWQHKNRYKPVFEPELERT